MNHRSSDLAYMLGVQAYVKEKEDALTICKLKREELERSVQPDIIGCKAILACRNEKRDQLRQQLRQLPAPSQTISPWMRWYGGTIAFVLWIAGVCFAHLALAPFGLGWYAWIIALAIGIVAPASLDHILVHFDSRRFIRIASIIALFASLVGLAILAILRGDVVSQYLKIAVEGASDSGLGSPESGQTFYQEVTPILKYIFLFMTLGIEISLGLIIFEIRKYALGAEREAAKVTQELQVVEDEMVSLLRHQHELENRGAIFEANFMSLWHQGLLKRLEENSRQLLGIFALAGLLFSQPSNAAEIRWPWDTQEAPKAESLNIIVGIDLSLSVASKSYDGKTQYQKSIEAVSEFVSRLPRGTELKVGAITGQSFTRPYVLLSAKVPSDPGPLEFIDQIALGRRKIAGKILKLGSSTEPFAPETDVFGYLVFASSQLRGRDGRKVLILYSDMRHSAPIVNLEKSRVIDVGRTLKQIKQNHLLADLNGVDVYIYAHTLGRDIGYWQNLKSFWTEYFSQASTHLRIYAMTAGVPDLSVEPQQDSKEKLR